MRKIIQVLFISFLTCGFLFGQQITEKSQNKKRVYLGLSTGFYFSNFLKSEEWGFAHYHTLSATFENKYNSGFNSGCFLGIGISNRFSLQPEIYYNHSKHVIIYHEWSRIGVIGTTKDANYTVSYSRMKLSFLPIFSFGKITKFGLLAGPYFDLPFLIKNKGQIRTAVYDEQSQIQISFAKITDNEIENDITGGLGGLIGFRLDVPLKQNYLCAEMRIGTSLYDVVRLPNIKENFITLNLIYLLKLK